MRIRVGLLILWGALLLFAGLPSEARTRASVPEDSARFAEASWIRRNIVPGVRLRQAAFRDSSLFGSNQYVSLLEIDPSRVVFGLAVDTVLHTVSDFVRRTGALAAVNGSFFSFSPGLSYNSVDYIALDGQCLARNVFGPQGRLFHQTGALAWSDAGFRILKADVLRDWERYIGAENVLTSGPLLRIGGRDEALPRTAFNDTRHPRTAVACLENGNILWIVVDGRAAEAAGMSLPELQQVLRWCGARDALNLDGGGSSVMYVYGGGIHEPVVSHPSDNRRFDHLGERKVANALYIRPR